MTFLWPAMFASLLVVPVLIYLYLLLVRRRRLLAARYAGLGLVSEAKGDSRGYRRHIPAIVMLAGILV